MEKEEEPPPAKSDIRYFLWYLRPFRRHFIQAVIFSAAIAFFNLLPAQVIRYILNEALPARNVRPLVFAVAILTILFILGSLVIHFRTRIVSRMSEGISSNLRRDLFFHIQRLRLSFFDNARIGKLMSRITGDTAVIQQFFTSGSHVLVVAILTFAGVTAISLHMNWKLTLFAMLPMPVLMILIRKYGRIAHRIYRVIRRQWGNLSARVSDGLGGIKEVKSFAREEHEDGRFGYENGRVYSLGVKAADLDAIYEPLIMFLSSLGTVMVIGVGGWLCYSGKMRIGTLVAFLLYLNLLYRPLWQINSLVHMWEHARAASEHITEIMRIPTEIDESPDAMELPYRLKGAVEFKNLSFSYQTKKTSREALKNLNFKVKEGERIAIVGPTGSGKTTLVSLISRFYDSDEGMILIDGRDIREYKLKYLRENIGIVLQDPFLFAGSIKQNILYGKPDASMEELEEATKAANIHKFIQSLPDGYSAQVGERGVKVSGGEKQRLAIARVLLKNPPILIFDEATSSLDSHTERLVQEALERLMEGRTTFIIAHRLSTVRNADRLLVLDEGKIVEQGRHEELLAKDGVYAYLYRLQFEFTESKREILNRFA